VNTDNLRVNQLPQADFAWYQRYLATIDGRDIDAYARFLSESCTMHFNNVVMAEGKVALVHALAEYWKSYAGLEHELLNIYGTGRAFMLEALNHYVRHDGKNVSLRAVALTDRDEAGLVTSIRVYTDTAPLFS
jgi:hypothetical protein